MRRLLLLNVDLMGYSKVKRLKSLINRIWEIQPEQQKLIYGQDIMNDDWMIGHYMNTDKANVYVGHKAATMTMMPMTWAPVFSEAKQFQIFVKLMNGKTVAV